MNNGKLEKLIVEYERLKPRVQDITRKFGCVVFKLSNLDGWMIDQETCEVEETWGLIDDSDDAVLQSQQWLALEKQMRELGKE